MAHGTLINGTAYGITGGKCLVGGTEYSIKKGRTLISGTSYEINFAPEIATVTVEGTGSRSYAYIKINENQNGMSEMVISEGTYYARIGSIIECFAYNFSSSGIYVNGGLVARRDYDYTVTKDITVRLIDDPYNRVSRVQINEN